MTLICTGITFVAVYRGTGSPAAPADRQRDRAATRASSRTTSRSSDGALAARGRRGGDPLRARPALQRELDAAVRDRPRRRRRARTDPSCSRRWRPDNGETLAQQAQENRLSAQLLTGRDGYSTLTLPDVGNLRLLKRAVHLPAGGLHVTVGGGRAAGRRCAHAQRGVARAFILAGILALAGALLAAYLIGTRVSRPLRRMAAVAARVDAGDLHPRIHDLGGQGR